jgi:hypothetical protein
MEHEKMEEKDAGKTDVLNSIEHSIGFEIVTC